MIKVENTASPQPLIRLVIDREILEITDLAISLIDQLIYHSYIILLMALQKIAQ
jgi:hypothetical protein